MFNISRVIKKRIYFIFALVLFFILVIFITTHAVLFVNFKDGYSGKIYVKPAGNNSPIKEYQVTNKRLIVVKKGNYSVTAYSGQKTSIAHKKAKTLSTNKIGLAFSDQKTASMVSRSTLDCVNTNKEAFSVIFYSCGGATQTFEIVNGDKKITLPRPGIFEDEGDSINQNDKLSNRGFDKPSVDGLKLFDYNNNTLSVQLLDFAGKLNPPINIKNIGLNDFSESNVTTSINGTSFVVHEKKEILRFDNLSKKVYEISGAIELSSDFIKTLHSTEEFIFIVYSVDPSNEIEEESNLDNFSKNFKNKIKKQKIYRVDVQKEKVEEIKTNDKFVINKTSINKHGDLLVEYLGGSFSILKSNAKTIEEIPLESRDIVGLCWKDDNQLVYLTSDKKKMFYYSLNEELSKLEYQTDSSFIDSLYCSGVTPYFSLSSKTISSEKGVLFFKLTDKSFSESVRLESQTPFFATYSGDSFLIEMNGEKLQVTTLYDSQGNGIINKQEIINQINKKLADKGVNGSAIEYVFK